MSLIINRFYDSWHLTKILILQLITTKSGITKSNFTAFFTKSKMTKFKEFIRNQLWHSLYS